MGRVLARGFITAYREAAPGSDLGALDWYRGLHGTRLLLDGAATADGRHPLAALAPAAATAVAAATGSEIRSVPRTA